MNVCLIYNITKVSPVVVGVVEVEPNLSNNEILGRWLARSGLTTRSMGQFHLDFCSVLPAEELAKWTPLNAEREDEERAYNLEQSILNGSNPDGGI